MADSRQEMELLFFDTFSHENTEELNLDLVQFPRPVVIGEVRVVPLQTRVLADVPGGVRLGATNPSSFKLELFVNNLSKPNASTFEKLGVLDYKENVDIQLCTDIQIPTDGLILKGWYNTITVAVYGVLTLVKVESESPPPPPPPQPRTKPQVVEPRPVPLTTQPQQQQQQQQQQPLPAEWEQQPPPQMVPPPAPQHPLDFIQQQIQAQLKQVIQSAPQQIPPSQTLQQPPPQPVPTPVTQPKPMQPPGHMPQELFRPADEAYQQPGLPQQQGLQPQQQASPMVHQHMGQPPREFITSPEQEARESGVASRYSPVPREPSREQAMPVEPAESFPNPDRGYEESQSRDSYDWNYRETQRRRESPERLVEGRDYPTSREGSREPRESRDRGYREGSKESKDVRDWEKDRDRNVDRQRQREKDGGRDYDHDRDRNYEPEKETGYERREPLEREKKEYGRDRNYDRDGRERNYERDRDRDIDRDRDYDRMRDRDRNYERGRDYERDVERDREFDNEKYLGRERGSQESLERNFRDRPRSPSWSRSRSRSYSRERSRSRSWSPRWRRSSRSKSKSRSRTSSKSRQSPQRSLPGQRSRSASRSPPLVRPRSRSRSWSPRRADSPRRGESPRRVMSPTMELQRRKDTIPEPLSPSPEDSVEPGELNETGDVLFEPLSPDQQSLEEPAYMSDGEIQEGDGYEEISSSEDEFIEMESGDIITDFEMEDDTWNYGATSFNPYQCFLNPLTAFPDISLTEFEQEKTKVLSCRPLEAEKLLEIVDEFSQSDHHDKWVESLEGVPALLPKGLSYLVYKEHNQAVLQTLIDWALEGLDEDKAISQPESVFKIRHLKMGFRLTGALCSCDPTIALRLLSKDVQQILLKHFQSPCMSFSLKLHIVSALDLSTRFKDGIDWFLGVHQQQTERAEKPETSRPDSCYQRAVQCMLQKKQVVRVVVAMTSFLRKIHIYEVMTKLSTVVDRVLETLPDTDEETGSKAVDNLEADGDLDLAPGMPQLNESYTDTLIVCLEEILKVFTLAPTHIAQPGRTLPGQSMFEVKSGTRDPYPNLYHMANSCRLLESLFVLVSSSSATSVPTLFGAVRSLLQKLTSSQHGLIYLTSKCDITNGIIRSLLQMADYNRDDVAEENAAQQLGIEMIYYLQTLQCVDQLLEFHNKAASQKVDMEDQEIISVLHGLYCMTFTPQGRESVIAVLSLDDNLKCLLPFVELQGDIVLDQKVRKSVSAGYSAELLMTVVHYSENVEMLQKFSSKLTTLGEADFNSKTAPLQDWLAPFKDYTSIDVEGLPSIIKHFTNHADDVAKLPRSLITTLRVLRHLAIAPPNEYPDEKAEELKYNYVLIELFSSDCFQLLVTSLQKLTELMMRPWQNGIPVSSEILSLYLAIIKPALEIVKATLQYLIRSRGAEFRDLTALPVLLDLHTVMCSVPTSSFFSAEVSKIQRDVVDTLAAFTQPLMEQSNTTDSLSNSLWTLTLKQLLTYTMKTPYCYLSGLQLLSELLPLPLPLQTKEPLSSSDEMLAINTRKLWSAHLLSLHDKIYNIIHTLVASSCHPLQQILRKICWQLSDLAAPTAALITKCIMDILLENMEAVGKGEAPETEEQKVAIATRSRFLNLLAYVLSQPAIKCTMLQLMGSRGEEKYSEVLPKMLEILNHVSDRPLHVQDQECIVSILQSLCDMEVTLMSSDSKATIEEQLVNALPSSDQLSCIIAALLEHIAHPNHKYDTVLPCIRALVMLTEHDFSFYILRETFEKHKLAFYRLLQRIKFKFSKDSSDCLSTLSTTLEFLRLLVSTEPADEDELSVTRTITLTNEEVREVVAWKQNLTNHPLVDLQKLLEEGSKEEETLESLVDSISSLIKVLKDTDEDETKKPEVTAPSLPEPELLHNLFNMRATYVITDSDDERICSAFWQTAFVTDDAEVPDLVMFDLDEMCRRYCHDFNLEEELQKTIGLSVEEDLTKPRRPKDRRKSQEFVTHRGRGMRRPFVAPMRGRGIARGLAAQANRQDPFRSRTPNTSRPPSMHVDDFMKLEKDRAQTPENDGGMSSNRRSEKDFMPRGRGRGNFDRGRGGGGGFQPRGRFFTPPASGGFSRREGMGSRGGNGSLESPGGMQYNDRSKPAFISPRPFNNRGHDNRPGSADRRGGRDNRFQPRGGARGHWSGARFKDDRFSGPGMNFQGRREPGRHVRSFTK